MLLNCDIAPDVDVHARPTCAEPESVPLLLPDPAVAAAAVVVVSAGAAELVGAAGAWDVVLAVVPAAGEVVGTTACEVVLEAAPTGSEVTWAAAAPPEDELVACVSTTSVSTEDVVTAAGASFDVGTETVVTAAVVTGAVVTWPLAPPDQVRCPLILFPCHSDPVGLPKSAPAGRVELTPEPVPPVLVCILALHCRWTGVALTPKIRGTKKSASSLMLVLVCFCFESRNSVSDAQRSRVESYRPKEGAVSKERGQLRRWDVRLKGKLRMSVRTSVFILSMG